MNIMILPLVWHAKMDVYISSYLFAHVLQEFIYSSSVYISVQVSYTSLHCFQIWIWGQVLWVPAYELKNPPNNKQILVSVKLYGTILPNKLRVNRLSATSLLLTWVSLCLTILSDLNATRFGLGGLCLATFL